VAGSLFTVDVGVPGLPVREFAGWAAVARRNMTSAYRSDDTACRGHRRGSATGS
jgi:hypothetical protein